jgi:sporulation protein YunB
MIEVCNSNIWYIKKQFPKKKNRVIALFLVLIVLFGGYFYYKFVVTEQILQVCKDYSLKIATESINKSVLETLKDKIKYSDLITIEKNANGNVSLMTVNSYKVNNLNREISLNITKNIEHSISQGVPVPFFLFSGINLLSGYGPTIKYKAVFINKVESNFSSIFQTVGMNQTLHSIYIDISVEMVLEMPANSKKESCKGSVLVGETIIVGKVPDTYLNGKIFS